MITTVPISAIQSGPIRHKKLPKLLIERIKQFKTILSEVETTPLDETLNGFKRDMQPEREVQIWEVIAKIYKENTNETMSLAEKKEIFKNLLLSTM